jgi:prepilin-type N-terminal cleavage/methylation domain-containing protein
MKTINRQRGACTRVEQKGFTLTEIAIVLGIIGIILGAVWSAASGVYASANSSKITQQLGYYVAAVRSACSNGGCAANAPIPAISASLPSLPGTNIAASAVIDTTGTNIAVTITGIPTTSGGTAFCNGISTAVSSTLGGVAGINIADAETFVLPTATCTSQAVGAVPTCNGGGTGYTVTEYGSNTCTQAEVTNGSAPAGDGCSAVAAGLCNGTRTSMGVLLPLTF